MRTNEITREQISALADSELADSQVDSTLAALRQNDARADWEIYHQIGDVLRSDDMEVMFSPGFSARMSAMLDAEPTIVAPIAAAASSNHPSAKVKRWAVPSMVAAAAMAAVAFLTTPQLMVALKGEPTVESASIASAPQVVERGVALVASTSASEGEVLRDPRIDDYLLAHQRFSPSVYSTAQYARSATFASDTGK